MKWSTVIAALCALYALYILVRPLFRRKACGRCASCPYRGNCA